MSWWVAGSMMALSAVGKGIAADRSINRQKAELRKKEAAFKKKAINAKNAYEMRYYQTEQMHSDKISAMKKQAVFNTNKLLSMAGGSGASVGEGSPAHIVVSESARNKFNINSFQKRSGFELSNLRDKGSNEQSRFTAMATEAQSSWQYLSDHGKQMTYESMLSGGLSGFGQGVGTASAMGKDDWKIG